MNRCRDLTRWRYTQSNEGYAAQQLACNARLRLLPCQDKTLLMRPTHQSPQRIDFIAGTAHDNVARSRKTTYFDMKAGG